MQLYNTLTRTIDPITPLQAPIVTVYTCGPTVYDYAHIGHWFNYIRMDILVRSLRRSGLQPTWVMNITDVGHLVSDADDGEDKLEKGARREGKTAWEVAEYYTADFLDCMQKLHITTPDHITKATDHIAEQIALIETLEAKGYTYVISDGVYYDTSRFEGYAAFARLDLDGMQAGARVSYNGEKRNPTDFALWKFSPPVDATDGGKRRDMEWQSPWGVGFPGWHIECSAMSMKYLGDTLDIHTGGIDHIPVHHTNEIAQSEAATGKRFANHWMHSNHLMVDGEKVSKSLGNGVRLQELVAKGFSPEAVRLHILESHYRGQSQFSLDSLQAAQNRLRNLHAMAALRWQTQEQLVTTPALRPAEAVIQLDQLLADDLNTPAALALLSQIETDYNKALVGDDDVEAFVGLLTAIDDALGLQLMQVPNISAAQQQLIAERQSARAAGDWTASDTLRDTLLAQHIHVRDTANGPIWSWQ